MDENSNFRKENEGELSAFSTEHLTVGYDKMPLIKDVNLQRSEEHTSELQSQR